MGYFVIWIKQHTAWLYSQIYENQFFFIDLWSFVHLWSGFVIFSLLLALKYKQPWLWLIIYLFLYEVAELTMLYVSLNLFKPETIKDQFTDIFIGIFGGYLNYLYVYQMVRYKIEFFKNFNFVSLFVSLTIAFLWVSHSHFYFLQPENEDLFSMNIFIWRLLLVYFLLRIYVSLKSSYGKLCNLLPVFTTAYFTLYILSGIVTGNYTVLHIFNLPLKDQLSFFNISSIIYLSVFPFLTILSYEMICLMLNKAGSVFAQRYPMQSSVMEPVYEMGS